MKVVIANCQVPFIRGGGELQTEGLREALVRAGHQAEIVTLPFRFLPLSAVVKAMHQWQEQDWSVWDAGLVDLVIAGRFPSFHVRHPNKLVWLMHQHRPIYELWDTPYGEIPDNPANNGFRQEIIQSDTTALREARAVFTISRNVSNRLQRFNNIASKVIYHPPPLADSYRPEETHPFILCPSRLESHKRQDLLIRAMSDVPEPVIAYIVGEGSMLLKYWKLVEQLGLQQRVRFLGCIDHNTMRQLYSNCLAVFFGPFDEDYGYITLESMLSGKPVITCDDSGGPLEFVQNDHTGFVLPPDPQTIAEAVARLAADIPRARQMGQNALAHYRSLNIGWDSVVQTLLPP